MSKNRALNKKGLEIFGILALVLFAVNLLASVCAQNNYVCCEETKSGEFCQNVPPSECKEGAMKVPARCEDTGEDFCKAGTCIYESTGKCEINVPKTVCIKNGGAWDRRDKREIPICQEGCCITPKGLSNFFVTQVECRNIAEEFGIETQFDPSIKDELTCLAQKPSEKEGACVVKKGYQTECKNYLTEEECLAKENSTFYPGLLCTATINGEAISNCAKSKETMCYKEGGSTKVYFMDSCGNRANVYDANKYNDPDYWTKIQEPECAVGPDGSSTCGNCNYRLGSSCTKYDSSHPNTKNMEKPEYGEFVCAGIMCEYDTNRNGKIDKNERYYHGESWCAEVPGTYYHLPLYLTYDPSNNDLTDEEKKEIEKVRQELRDTSKYNLPGSRYVRLYCDHGEVKEDPCAEFRQEICVEGEIVEDFSYAKCVENLWRDCVTIENYTECVEKTEIQKHTGSRKVINLQPNTKKELCQSINTTMKSKAHAFR